MRLLPGIFGTEFNPPPPDKRLFGLRSGQMRSYPGKIGHNSGWYNHRGEKIGWGDLSQEDADRISLGLQDDEAFIILSESDSFWAFADRIGGSGSTTTTTPTGAAPGIAYLVEHARIAIFKGEIWYIESETRQNSMTTSDLRERLQALAPDPETAFQELRKAVGGAYDGVNLDELMHEQRHDEGERDDCGFCRKERKNS